MLISKRVYNVNNDFPTQAFNAYKTKLAGLPSFCRLTMYELLEYCDYSSGIISINTLDEIAKNDFYVTPSPGRKKESISGDTLRNAFRTIKKICPAHFKFTTKNQRIIIEMPFLRELYQQFYSEKQQVATEVVTDDVAVKNHASINQEACFEEELAVEDTGEDAAASLCSVKDIKYNITNKLTSVADSNFSKNLIQPNFQPSQETIDIALSRGLSQVTNHEEIQKFISYNQANGSLWADFNPVFLTWLERESEYRQTKQQQKYKLTRSNHDECRRTKNNSYDSLMAAVLRENSDACAPSEQFKARSIIEAELSHEQAHCVALGAANEHLRPALHQPEWEHGQRSMVRSTSGTNANGIGEWYESN